MVSNDELCALVPAAGSGTRMRSNTRKPLLRLKSAPLICHVLARLQVAGRYGATIVAVHPEDLEEVKRRYGSILEKRFGVNRIISGGGTRRQTVLKMLDYVPDSVKMVLIHDGARPLVRPDTVMDVVQKAENSSGGAISAVPADATVKEVNCHGTIKYTPPRRNLWIAQTPQVFWAEVLINSHREAEKRGWKVTDDAEVVEKAGHKVVAVKGNYDNIKITNPQDLRIAEVLLDYQKEKGLANGCSVSGTIV